MNLPNRMPRIEPTQEAMEAAANDKDAITCRSDLARFSACQLIKAGTELHVIGHLLGSDRTHGKSPFGHGNDETVAISILLRVAGELTSASADLAADGRQYAASALVRQMVEIEYLAWAFETRNGEGERWLRSTKDEREKFFKPAKLRAAAGQGTFRGKDYGYHCELGGHPVPQAGILLEGNSAIGQLMLSDLLGHVGRIWDHLCGWARQNKNGGPILQRSQQMSANFQEWKLKDKLVDLPPP
jgi:hypothetical protein